MSARRAVLPAVVVAGSLAAACIQPPAPQDGEGGSMDTRTVAVTGEGRASEPPGEASLTLGVQVVDARADRALGQVGLRVDALLDALVEEGIPRTDIRTSAYRLVPETVRDEKGRPTGETRYRMIQTFDVEVRELQRLPAIIGAASDAGVTNIDDIAFGVGNAGVLREQARVAAMKDARGKAETLAQEVGMRLGHAVSIREGTSGGPTPMPRMQTMSTESAQVPGGMFEEVVRVEVVFELSER